VLAGPNGKLHLYKVGGRALTQMEGGGFPGLLQDFAKNTYFTSHCWSEDGDYVVAVANTPASNRYGAVTEIFVMSAINGVEWR